MSFLVGGKADKWAQVYTDDHFDIDKGLWDVTGKELIDDMDREFTNVAKEKEARNKLTYIRQGKASAGNFFKEFKLLFVMGLLTSQNLTGTILTLLKDTGYKKDKSHILTLVERAVDHNLLYDIIKGWMEPFEDYKELKKVVTGDDNIRQQWAEQKRGYGYAGWWNANLQGQNHGQSSTQQNRQEPKVAPRAEYPAVQQRDTTGTTFRGTGRPMDINQVREKQLCFNCDKLGHMSRNCPHKRKAVVWGIMLNMSEQEHMDFINDLGFPKAPQ
ncbi:hypothetical protein J3R30DRAFT_3706161 [Lentinula aciculospora]|uniref:CCHC-type domain-containing protein n=1 Tax=Lentinula aciculospora TaxID=153920 RepID=A0A9W9A6H0_9AGAR|nr:hypothetical protein J3R30DRAFT_3706161 [Lentinula aciculospora]